MKNTIKNIALRTIAALSILLLVVPLMEAQAPNKLVGTITAVHGNTLLVKTDAGEEHSVTVPIQALLKSVAPGQKDLSTAQSIHLSDLANGDRVLIKLAPTISSAQALQIIAIKQSDLVEKQQHEREDWQRNGVVGFVKSLDADAGIILLTTGMGSTARIITLHTTPATILKRYASASVSYDQAAPAPMNAIHIGDQLRARGTKNTDGSELTAVEAVSGSFLNLSGILQSINATASTITLKDLSTKNLFTIHLPAQAQMRRLPDQMAQMLARRLKAGAGTEPVAATKPSATKTMEDSRSQNNGHAPDTTTYKLTVHGPDGDPQQFLNRAPVIHIYDLQKGEVVMLVANDGGAEITAITLLAGVESLLDAPAASKSLLSDWTLNSGGNEIATP